MNFKLMFCAALCALLLCGCLIQPSVPAVAAAASLPTAESAVTFTDSLGRQVTVSRPERVISLMGSFTHTWLLAGGELCAVTQDSFDEGTVDTDAALENLGAMKSPDMERLLALSPDFVLLSSKIVEHVKLRDTLEAANIPCAYFEVEEFAQYLSMLDILTDITQRKDLYDQNGLAVQTQIDNAIASRGGKPSPKVLYIRAFSNGAKAKGSDNMTGKMLKDLGCVNIADSSRSLLEELSMEEIILQDPEFIFVTTMGTSSEAAIEALAKGIQSNPAWQGLAAVREGRYVLLEKELFHLKPNNRWGESYELLADILDR